MRYKEWKNGEPYDNDDYWDFPNEMYEKFEEFSNGKRITTGRQFRKIKRQHAKYLKTLKKDCRTKKSILNQDISKQREIKAFLDGIGDISDLPPLTYVAIL